MIERPLIVIGAPRSGTTILQRCLMMHPTLWHLRAESHNILEGPFHPARTGKTSNRHTGEDTSPRVLREVRQAFYQAAINLNEVLFDPSALLSTSSTAGRMFSRIVVPLLGKISQKKKTSQIRFLEKTPGNTLRIPLLNRLFPDALFVWNWRLPEHNIDSLISGWQTDGLSFPGLLRPRFTRGGYPIARQMKLQDYPGRWTKFTLVPGWEQLRGKTTADMAALQYYQCNRYALGDLRTLNPARAYAVQHEEFIRRPLEHVVDIFKWAGLSSSSVAERFARTLPKVNAAGSKQRGRLRHPDEVRRVMRDMPPLEGMGAWDFEGQLDEKAFQDE